MPTIYTPNVVQVEMIYQSIATRCENVYNVSKGAPATLADLVALYDVFRLWELNTARPQRTTSISLLLIVLRAMDSAGAPFYESSTNLPIVGSNAGGALPSYLTVCCKHSTGLGGRSYRGRSYWVGLGASQTVGENLAASTRTAIETIYNTLRTNLAAAGWTLGVVSKYSGVLNLPGRKQAIPRATGLFTPITGTSVEGHLDTNRHRKFRQTV